MKRAPKELLDALRGIAERNSGLYVENGAQELLALLEEWQPENEDGVGSAVEILRKDVAKWKKRVTEAEAETRLCETRRWESAARAEQAEANVKHWQTICAEANRGRENLIETLRSLVEAYDD